MTNQEIMAAQEADRLAYADHLQQNCSFDCAFCAKVAVRFNWDEIELLCPDARWVKGSKHPPKTRGSGHAFPGRPPSTTPRRNRLAVLLTDAERARVDAYAAVLGLPISIAARLVILQAVDGDASRAADTASERDEP